MSFDGSSRATAQSEVGAGIERKHMHSSIENLKLSVHVPSATTGFFVLFGCVFPQSRCALVLAMQGAGGHECAVFPFFVKESDTRGGSSHA